MVTDAHTGVMTTVRRDGMPIALPLWFACVDRIIWVHSRGRKLQRIAHDPRASFLVESGERWAELRAVHFTGRAEAVEPDSATLALVEAETARKYDAFRTPANDMPAATAPRYAAMRWIRFTPDDRVLSWDNAKIAGGSR
jgi:nitroimidazol reductase NimA-like FMN-containing flavoprotein (pyridoxamine 5'-phosphate oxidase superfamily)